MSDFRAGAPPITVALRQPRYTGRWRLTGDDTLASHTSTITLVSDRRARISFQRQAFSIVDVFI